MHVHERHRLRSGRQVAVHTLARGPRTVVFCHPAPGSGAFDPDPAATAACDVTVLAVDRPGYGQSELSDDWATVHRAADDIAEVLDARQIDRVGVVGWSAGGRVALALATRRPEIVERVVVVGTPAPNEAVPWVPEEYVRQMERLREVAPPRAAALLAPQFPAPDDPASDDALAMLGLAPGQTLDAAARARLGAMLEDAFVQGGLGLAADILGYCLQPWGFEPKQVKAEVLLLYGERDQVAGQAHAEYWHRELRAATVEIVPQEGHLLVIPTWKRALSHLTP